MEFLLSGQPDGGPPFHQAEQISLALRDQTHRTIRSSLGTFFTGFSGVGSGSCPYGLFTFVVLGYMYLSLLRKS